MQTYISSTKLLYRLELLTVSIKIVKNSTFLKEPQVYFIYNKQNIFDFSDMLTAM